MSSNPQRMAGVVVAAALVAGAALAYRRASEHTSPRDVVSRFQGQLESDGSRVQAVWADATLNFGIQSVHDNDLRGRFYIPEGLGPGVGIFDLEGDGDLDIFVAAGGPLVGDRPSQPCELWVNDDGRFTERAVQLGAAVPGPAFGVNCGDVDSDGDIDVFLTRLGPDVLLINEGGRFVDRTGEMGLGQTHFGTGATFLDYDQDGNLDLYVAQYLNWSAKNELECFQGGTRDYCGPMAYEAPAQDRLYRGLGGGRFEDVTEAAGLGGQLGNGLGAMASDFDGDGQVDIYVANDASPAFLWRNLGDGTFEEAALRLGCAYDGSGVAIAGMGIACEDLNGDGDLDLLVTNIFAQSHLGLLRRGNRFRDGSRRLNLYDWSLPATGFGVAVFDQDLDGTLDLYVANGAVNLNGARGDVPNPYAEPDHFARLVDGSFRDATEGAGVLLAGAGRGLAAGDLDGDGDLDLVVANNGGPLKVLANLADGAGAWLLVDVRTAAGSPALGARVEARCGEQTQVREVRAQTSYLSSSDPRVHFGFGAAADVDELTVTWATGETRTFQDVGLRQVLEVQP